MENKVIYGGSFDPITYGHKDIVERAAKYFDHLTVGIGVNADKEGKYLFSLQERLYLVRQALKDILNVDVVAYRGMTTDFAYENQYDMLIRGLRNAKDFEEEQILDQVFKRQQRGLETLYLNAKQSMQDLSSSAAKNILSAQGDIRQYVPMIVKQAMEGRLLGQYMIGITGETGSGKSYTTQEFLEFCQQNGIMAHNIDLDKIGHDIQSITLQEPIYQATRQKIIQSFGDDVANEDGSINRKVLGPKVFFDPEKMNVLNAIMSEPMNMRVNRLMYNQKGIFLYNAALIVEAKNMSKVNNNILLLDVPKDIQTQRLQARGLNTQEVSTRRNSQLSKECKKNIIEEQIQQDQHGDIQELQSPHTSQDAHKVFNKLIAQIDTFGELRFGALLHRMGVQGDHKQRYIQMRNMYDRPIAGDARWDEIAQKMQGSHHKRLHIVDCMNELYEVKHLVEEPDIIECALLFHDSIYDPQSHTNEEDSAQYAEKILQQRGVSDIVIQKVKRLIMVTKIGSTPITPDEKYIKDIDNAILGKEKRKRMQYQQDVRREFGMFTDKEYGQGRINFLEGLSQESPYMTQYFQQKYGDQAKINNDIEIAMWKHKLQ